jgi:hypothetical protein
MVDRSGLLSAWLGQHLPEADVLPFDAIPGTHTTSPITSFSNGMARLTISAKAWPADASATT